MITWKIESLGMYFFHIKQLDMNAFITILIPTLLAISFGTIVTSLSRNEIERTCIHMNQWTSKQCPDPTYFGHIYLQPEMTGPMEIWQFQQKNCLYSIEKVIFLELLFMIFLTCWIWVLAYIVS